MSATPEPPARAEIVVDLGAIRHNVRRLRELVSPGSTTGYGPPALMVVVKADGYGHGMVEAARAARDAGAEWLGVATADEAVALRTAGDTGRVLSWLAAPGDDYRAAVEADVDVTAYSVAQLEEIVAAGHAAGRVARVQLKVDTGLSRGGASRDHWSALFESARAAEVAGTVVVTGVWSHFACADEPDHPANEQQEKAFREALDLAAEAGLSPEVRHLSNSAGALLRPSARFDLVRIGLAAYGLTPGAGGRSARRSRARAGDDRPRPGGAGQGPRGGRRCLLRPHLRRRPADARRARADGVRRRHPVARVVLGGGPDRAAAVATCSAGSAWTSSWSPSRDAEPGDEIVALRHRTRRRADRPGLGRVVRHHQLRDRHAHRRTAKRAAGSTRTPRSRRHDRASSRSTRPAPTTSSR